MRKQMLKEMIWWEVGCGAWGKGRHEGQDGWMHGWTYQFSRYLLDSHQVPDSISGIRFTNGLFLSKIPIALIVISPLSPLDYNNFCFFFASDVWPRNFWLILISYFVECPSIWVCLQFSHDWSYAFLAKLPQKWCALYASQSITPRGSWCWYILLLVLLTLTIQVGVCCVVPK